MFSKNKLGFTLVELAIVLVIIGLLIGGVLTANDLLRASRLQSTITQVQQFNAAATTFRTKYGGIPGDLLQSRATSFNLTTVAAGASIMGYGDGNGLIESYLLALPARPDISRGEIMLFWKHLSEAALIPATLNAATYSNASSLVATTGPEDYAEWLPRLKLRDNAFAYAYGAVGINYYLLTGFIAKPSGSITPYTAPAFTPQEAKNLDEKLDDGKPGTGLAIAVTNIQVIDNGAAPASGVCVNSTPSPKAYNVAEAYADSVSCRIQLRTSF